MVTCESYKSFWAAKEALLSKDDQIVITRFRRSVVFVDNDKEESILSFYQVGDIWEWQRLAGRAQNRDEAS